MQSSMKKNHSSELIFSQSSNVRLDYTKMKKTILRRFANEEFDRLDQELAAYKLSRSDILGFFSEEGQPIFNSAMSGCASELPLQFLYDHVPVECLKMILEKESYKILSTFLQNQAYIESLGWYNGNVKENQIKKFKFLLSIDKDGVIDFMKQNENQPYMTTEIKENFSIVLMSLKSRLS